MGASRQEVKSWVYKVTIRNESSEKPAHFLRMCLGLRTERAGPGYVGWRHKEGRNVNRN